MNQAEQLAQEQLNAYNGRDITAFLKCYHRDVEVYDFPDTLIYKGIEEMEMRYSKMFDEKTELNCKLVSRMVLGKMAIDQEEVEGLGDETVHAIAMYEVIDGLIGKVWFIRSS